MRTIILFSGGRESLINLHIESKVNKDIICVLYDYGQKSFRRELLALNYYAKKYKVKKKVIKINIKIPKAIKEGKRGNDHVINRNLIFISHAINYFYIKDKIKFLVGCVKHSSKYIDGDVKFLKDINTIISKLYPNVVVDAHTKNFKGYETYRYVLRNTDYSHLWFCMSDGEKPCGKCEKCLILRKENIIVTI
jgi:7-cyano-7-deazaguanine synthase